MKIGYIFYILTTASSFTTVYSSKDDSSLQYIREVPFLWGTATAAYQIEGAARDDGRGPSIWDKFSYKEGKVHNNDNGDIADDSYHKYLEDIRLMKAMGVKAYRFSISWSRILPNGSGKINYLAINHYNKLIDELLRNHIEPLVTLYHWDMPLKLEDDYNGWLDRKVIKDFMNYADICFENFGDRVRYWITINEPWTFVFLGYVVGIHAPGRCSDRTKCKHGNSATEGYIAAHHVLLAHANVVQLYRSKYQKFQRGVIGITLNQDWNEPLTNNISDIQAAERKNVFSMAWFGDPVVFGDYPDLMKSILGGRLPKFSVEESDLLRGSFDFWALNHYSTKYISEGKQKIHSEHEGGWAVDMNVTESIYSLSGQIIGPPGDSPWLQMVPWGFYKTIKWNHERYAYVNGVDKHGQPKTSFPIYITENGCDVLGESQMSLNDALNDTFRIDYYREYILQMEKALGEGIDIRGYMAWSLLDNFEWSDGYTYRFGLHYVDYTTPERTRYPKASALWYGQYIRTHAYYKIYPDGKVKGKNEKLPKLHTNQDDDGNEYYISTDDIWTPTSSSSSNNKRERYYTLFNHQIENEENNNDDYNRDEHNQDDDEEVKWSIFSSNFNSTTTNDNNNNNNNNNSNEDNNNTIFNSWKKYIIQTMNIISMKVMVILDTILGEEVESNSNTNLIRYEGNNRQMHR